ncbi:acyl-CoA dehydrogenase [Sphingomonas panacis]|uniref:3-methylmercaptopropionyl-CoA dehydrogenase n=1 Tax=Sphingomonas panacis TaxID=1560345 RepID=A0A1B3Z798_9SPHN|nr:acyl-CoA dehydrogenase [Sphingomonas panacis]AOH83296.1 acyl-CoA dehydrogenase [Sphingomonas panacis]
MPYQAPLDSMLFALTEVAALDDLVETGAFEGLSREITAAILTEAGKLASNVFAPLNRSGDLEGCRYEGGAVVTPPGLKEAFAQFAGGGWAGLSAPAEFGGQAMPVLLDAAVSELWAASNMAFSLCPILARGTVAAISAHGTDEQKRLFLPHLVSGRWTGTMNLTEPQAGSDVGALQTQAVRRGDGTYSITGSKIFITFGEHDMAENIVHLVLARLPDAPAGTKGISLFIVPKFLINSDGSMGARNDVQCVGIEHKLGIHASPTCVMRYGEGGGATGVLLGRENGGMAAMFTMMNDARLSVGTQGLGIAERAFQQALAFAVERRQGRPLGASMRTGPAPIIEHMDVQRMLMTMKALVEAMRGLVYVNAAAIDIAHVGRTEEARRAALLRADLLTPVTKAWCTDMGVEVASIGVQIHGGMGFVEETGAAQHYRDARIAPIYEGTNGIQAIDLVTRKLGMDGGAALQSYLAELHDCAEQLAQRNLPVLSAALARGAKDLDDVARWLRDRLDAGAVDDALAGATPFLSLFGTVAGGHVLARGALVPGCPADRITLAQFYAANILSRADHYAQAATSGSGDMSVGAIGL